MIKHVWARAKDELCTVGELLILRNLLTCVNFIGEHNGSVHLFHAMPVHKVLCEHMKRCLVIVKVWITRIAGLYANLRKVVWPWSKYWLCKLYFCCGSSFDTVYHNKTCLGLC